MATPDSISDRPDVAGHVLVVDDDRRLRELLSQYLMDNGYRVTTAIDAEDARGKMQHFAFDLLVVDVMMPGESGVDFTDGIRKGRGRVPILMLTARGEPEDRIKGLEVGADDYLPKPFEPKELLLRIASILRRAGPDDAAPPVVRFGEFAFDMDKCQLSRNGEVVRLTTGETALLTALARKAGVVVSRSELGRGDHDSFGRAIDVQITRLRRKIEDNPRMPHHLQTVRGQGYVLWAD